MTGDIETRVTITRRETATERIATAMQRLRQAQARHAAARSGLDHLPDLVGLG